MKTITWFFETFNPENTKGLIKLMVFSFITMTILRGVINPTPVSFDSSVASTTDYMSMIMMSSLLIAIDAMLIVLLSWSHLKTKKDAITVATLVGATHVVFPLLTFSITAAVSFGTDMLGLPGVVASGVRSGIYFIALVFVASHLREVNEAVHEGDAELLDPTIPVTSWEGIKAIWPAVFAVSIDALMVGPAKIAFMARYSTWQFATSFLWIGIGVFSLVFTSGLIVLGIKAWIADHTEISQQVHRWDYLGSLMLVAVFIHFSIFAGVYVLYTFIPKEFLLSWQMIWGTTAILFLGYLLKSGNIQEIRKASRERAGLPSS